MLIKNTFSINSLSEGSKRRKILNFFQYKLEAGAYIRGVINGRIYCLQVYGPIIGGLISWGGGGGGL